MDTIVRADGLTKEYPMGEQTLAVLKAVDLDIARGEIIAVMGPSGSGKSTLLNLIGGLDRPTSGTVTINDADLGTMTDDELAAYRQRSVGFIFQSFNLVPTLSARHNVELPLVFAGLDRHERNQRSAAALERVGLDHRIDHLPTQMSGGEQQRVAIARAIVNDPAIILGDEPTGNLDTATGSEILRLIREMNAEGRTFLITTHDREVASIAHRIVHIRDGAITDIEQGGSVEKTAHETGHLRDGGVVARRSHARWGGSRTPRTGR